MQHGETITTEGRMYVEDEDAWYPVRLEVRRGLLAIIATVDWYEFKLTNPFRPMRKVKKESPPLLITPGVRRGLTNTFQSIRRKPMVCNPDEFVVSAEKNTIEVPLGRLLRYLVEIQSSTADLQKVKALWLGALGEGR